MAYLYKHTALQTNFNVNLTCLLPTDEPAGRPAGARHAARPLPPLPRLPHDGGHAAARARAAEAPRAAPHPRRLAKIFDALDEAIKIIRKSESRADAAEKLMKRVRARRGAGRRILEIRLYQLARLEIEKIREELAEKKKRLKEIEALLAKPKARWKLDPRRARRASTRSSATSAARSFVGAGEELEYDAEAYIVHEDATVVLSRDGWVKRVREVKDPRRRASARATRSPRCCRARRAIGSCSSRRTAPVYVLRVADVPATTGYGEPVQTLFKFGDGERVVVGDARARRREPASTAPQPALPGIVELAEDALTVLVATAQGYGFRATPDLTETTRAGRRLARVGDGDEIVCVDAVDAARSSSSRRRAARCCASPLDEVAELAGPGQRRHPDEARRKDDDRIVGALALGTKDDVPRRHAARAASARSCVGEVPVGQRAQEGAEGREARRRARRIQAPESGAVGAQMACDSYTAKDIVVLEGLEPVRKRPGMYIGGVDARACTTCLGDRRQLGRRGDQRPRRPHRRDAPQGRRVVTVSDNGRGIPVDMHPKYKKPALELILTTLHAGGKFEAKNYYHSGGLHGVGASVVNALSEKLDRARCKRDGAEWEQTFARGMADGQAQEARRRARHAARRSTSSPTPKIFPKVAVRRRAHRRARSRPRPTCTAASPSCSTTRRPARKVRLPLRGRHREYLGKLIAERRQDAARRRGRSRSSKQQDDLHLECALRGPRRPTSACCRSSTASPPRRAARTRTASRAASSKAVRNYLDRPQPRAARRSTHHRRGHPRGLVARPRDQDPAAAVPGADEGPAQQPRGHAASIDGIVRTALENALNANRTAGDAIANRVILAARARSASRAAAEQVQRKSADLAPPEPARQARRLQLDRSRE